MEQEPSTPPPENNPSNEAAPQEATESVAVSKDARTMALLAHILGIFTSFVVPLIIYLIKKDEDAFIADQSKEALNFHITVIIAYFALIVISIITVGFGALLFPVLGLGVLILGIIAGIKANDGVAYRYPFTIRLIK